MDNIVVCQTNDMPDSEWLKYAESFNCVFEKNFTAEFFKKKYLARGGPLRFTNCPSHINVPQKFLANLKMSYIF